MESTRLVGILVIAGVLGARSGVAAPPAEYGFEVVIEPSGVSSALAVNPEQGIRGTIRGAAVDLAGVLSGEEAWSGSLEVVAFGRDTSLLKVGPAISHVGTREAGFEADGLSGTWTHGPGGLELSLELPLATRAHSTRVELALGGDLIAKPSGSPAALELVASRSGAVLLLRVDKATDADGRSVPARLEIARAIRLVVDTEGSRSPVTISLRLMRNVEPLADTESRGVATCGLVGVVGGADERDEFAIDGVENLASIFVVAGADGGASRLLTANGTLVVEPVRPDVAQAYAIDWMPRRPASAATPEAEPNDRPTEAVASANDSFRGTLDSPADRDNFRFTAQAGDRVLVAVETAAGVAASRGGIVLTVRDAGGNVVASARSADSRPSRNFEGAAVAFRAPADIRYVAEVSDDTIGDDAPSVRSYTLAVSRNCGAGAVSSASTTASGARRGTDAPATRALPDSAIATANPEGALPETPSLFAPPADVNNSLVISNDVSDVSAISWSSGTGPFNVYKGSVAAGAGWAYNQTCFATSISVSTAQDTAIPAPGAMFYYLVSRQSGCDESALGRKSDGTPVPASGLCFSPGTGLLPAKPYFMMAFDTSGSMTMSVAGSNSCGFPSDRLGHGRCALKNMVQAFAGQVNFGLATYATVESGCAPTCYTACSGTCFPAEISTTGSCSGCGPRPGAAETRAGANIVVPMQRDNFWDPVPDASNLTTMLSWADNNCTGSVELFADGNTPLNGMLRDMYRYYANVWTSPAGSPSFTSPLGTSAQDRPCRSVNVILITDGDETCDNQADAVDAAADLYAGVLRAGILWKVKTYVINFAGGSVVNTNAIAAAGGTVTSYFATNETQLSQALSAIIGGAQTRETCDNADNNCNGCIDEGFRHFSDIQTLPGACCSWSNAPQRAACLTSYGASISPANPRGNLALLPCTTAAQQANPSTWLCYDPGESCDGIDNNGNGATDEERFKCGSPAHCPSPEGCNGIDDDCDGVVDEGSVCPNGCVVGPEVCDGCDNDCNGIADDGVAPVPCGQATPANCQGVSTCSGPQAVPPGGCAPGGWSACSNAPEAETCDGLDNDCNGAVDDSASCPCAQRQELCNGLDDNCNAQIDEGVTPPSPTELCGVSPSATRPECTTGVTVSCVGGSFVCSFPAAVCNGPGGCSGTAEVCDGLDNNCDGRLNENVANYGETCHSDDASPTPGDGACRATGTYVCSSPTSTACTAVKASCASLPGGCPELCDGIDNDCDGLVDEPYTNKGANASFFVKPAVIKTAPTLWEFAYEASRPTGDTSFPGYGNGYSTSAPAGVPLEKTSTCSVVGRIPWFAVTAQEAEQTCQSIGGTLCSLAQWQTGCGAAASCHWGYAPHGAPCITAYTPTKFCNLGPSYDFNPSLTGDQDGLLATASSSLKNCSADFSGFFGNVSPLDRIYDATGNLKELAKIGVNQYAVMGGAFNSASEAGSMCSFTYYQADQNFSGYDVGFRCCFGVDPTQ